MTLVVISIGVAILMLILKMEYDYWAPRLAFRIVRFVAAICPSVDEGRALERRWVSEVEALAADNGSVSGIAHALTILLTVTPRFAWRYLVLLARFVMLFPLVPILVIGSMVYITFVVAFGVSAAALVSTRAFAWVSRCILDPRGAVIELAVKIVRFVACLSPLADESMPAKQEWENDVRFIAVTEGSTQAFAYACRMFLGVVPNYVVRQLVRLAKFVLLTAAVPLTLLLVILAALLAVVLTWSQSHPHGTFGLSLGRSGPSQVPSPTIRFRPSPGRLARRAMLRILTSPIGVAVITRCVSLLQSFQSASSNHRVIEALGLQDALERALRWAIRSIAGIKAKSWYDLDRVQK